MLPGHCLRSRQHRPAGDLYQPAHGNPRHGTGGVQGLRGGGGIRQRLLGDAYAGRAPAGGGAGAGSPAAGHGRHGSQLRGIREPNRRDLQFCLCRADGRKGRRDRLFLPEPGSSASICSTARNYVFPWRYREATAGLCSRRTIWNTWWRTETLG